MKSTINGREYGFHWGMGAIEIYCDTLNCDLDGLEMITTIGRGQGKSIITLIMAGMINYAEINNEAPIEVTYRQMQAWLDELEQRKLNEILEDWKKSKYFGKTIAEYLFGEAPEAKTPKKARRSVKS